MQVSSTVISCLCYFAIFTQDPVLNDSNELCIISHTGGTVRADTSVVSFIGFHPTTNCLESRNYYADKLLFSNCLRIAVNLTSTDSSDSNCGWCNLTSALCLMSQLITV